MNLRGIVKKQRAFVRARDWEKFHTPKNLAAALTVEAGELLEIFQWLRDGQDDPKKLDGPTRQHVQEELADVFFYLVRLADVLNVDLEKAFNAKMRKNARKYPVQWARGQATKYDRLQKGRVLP